MILKRELQLLLLILLLFIFTGCSPINNSLNVPVSNNTSTAEQFNKSESKNQLESKNVSNSSSNRVSTKVVKVIDGDTIKVNLNGKEESVRFLLVNAPEKKDSEPFSMEATEFIKDLVENKTIELEIGIEERDNYNRILAYIWLDDEKTAQELLLENGLAKVAYVINDTTHLDLFKKVEKIAKDKNKGIWSIPGYADNGNKYNMSVINNSKTELEKNSNNVSANNGKCNIKGNINSKGKKIYHTTESQWYEKTKAEQMFCSEEEAKQSGFKKAG